MRSLSLGLKIVAEVKLKQMELKAVKVAWSSYRCKYDKHVYFRKPNCWTSENTKQFWKEMPSHHAIAWVRKYNMSVVYIKEFILIKKHG